MKSWGSAVVVVTVLSVAVLGVLAHAQTGAATPAPEQTVMGPGLYMFQTRVDAASCGDTERTGYVSSFYVMVDGIPGSRNMDMHLIGSAYWPSWTLVVSASGLIVGDAQVEGAKLDRASHFELKQDGKRFKGRGVRSYLATVQGKPQRCSLSYDALLARIDS